MRRKIIKVIQGVIFIGFSIQTAFGLAWMGCNIVHLQDFAEVSTGIYGGAVRLLGKAYPVMYVLQLFAACYAGQRLISRLWGHGQSKIRDRLSALWGSLALMALPMAMQCHMALLPYSLVCSAGLLQLSFCCELFEPGGTLEFAPFAGILSCCFVQVLLLPEYIFLGIVPVAVTLLLKRKGIAGAKARLKVLLFGAAAAAGVYALCLWNAGQGTENDISGIEWTLVKRICWPTLWVDYGGMPDKITVASDVVWESAYYPGNMDRIFKPAIEAAVSAGEAKPLLAEAAAKSWAMHYPMVVRQIGWDVLGYCVTPVILQLQLSGDAYESYSGRNYEIMRREAPVLTKHYVNYSSWWFAVAVLSTALLLIARLAAGERPYGRREGRLCAVVFCFAVCCVFWYTLQGAGIMDYKYTVFINQLWFLWSFKTLCVRRKDGGGNEKESGRT